MVNTVQILYLVKIMSTQLNQYALMNSGFDSIPSHPHQIGSTEPNYDPKSSYCTHLTTPSSYFSTSQPNSLFTTTLIYENKTNFFFPLYNPETNTTPNFFNFDSSKVASQKLHQILLLHSRLFQSSSVLSHLHSINYQSLGMDTRLTFIKFKSIGLIIFVWF